MARINEVSKPLVILFFSHLFQLGNYKDAHNLLQHMYKELSSHDIIIPLEMEYNLQLLHSYVIVRMHIRRGQHLNAARLLIRVAECISKFPSRIFAVFLFRIGYGFDNINYLK